MKNLTSNKGGFAERWRLGGGRNGGKGNANCAVFCIKSGIALGWFFGIVKVLLVGCTHCCTFMYQEEQGLHARQGSSTAISRHKFSLRL